ncbi:hypothetical protein IFM89_023117 [Coptis chinensis]|uniref:Ku70/Ku80 C-terminal arm domain-containing protein n=1 Tax=Coptis chinensis TaxID=261450 RepID=A0A835HWL6_9MAGN|nr:hypothetical protein IFM89_023117 [Coptis chinensis]
MKRVDLKEFSVCQSCDDQPTRLVSALQRHYAVLQALALDEDEMPELKDETLPDEQGMAKSGVVNALEEFKVSVFGENYDQEGADALSSKTESDAAKKRKAIHENAAKESEQYDWAELADSGKLKDLTVVELK